MEELALQIIIALDKKKEVIIRYVPEDKFDDLEKELSEQNITLTKLPGINMDYFTAKLSYDCLARRDW